MKPVSEASGVRSSWLALARKSARIRSAAPGVGLVGQVSRPSFRPEGSEGNGRQAARQNRPADAEDS